MNDSRPEIPAPIKRQLRQEAGFGCCLCGNPVFEYHHIRPYSEATSHDPAEMMVLCPNHHHEATVGALTVEEQRGWKQNPTNVANGSVEGLLKARDSVIAVGLGSCEFVGPGFKLVVDGKPLLALERSEADLLQLSLELYDAEDNLLLTIVNNEWIAGDPLPWDFEFGHRWLTLRRKARDVAIQIDARKTPTLLSGEMWCKGQQFLFDQRQLTFDGVVQDIGFLEMGLVGMSIQVDTTTKMVSLVPDPKYGEGKIISWPDRAERVQKCIHALAELEAGRRV